jgi:hypothetical protein
VQQPGLKKLPPRLEPVTYPVLAEPLLRLLREQYPISVRSPQPQEQDFPSAFPQRVV